MRSERGFTLLEVMVAFVIAGAALAVLFRSGLDGVRAATLSSRTQEAVARASAHLAAIGSSPHPSDRQGDEGDGYHWHVRIVELASATPATTGPRNLSVTGAPPPQRLGLVSVSVAISWGGVLHRSVELDSERLVAGAAGGSP